MLVALSVSAALVGGSLAAYGQKPSSAEPVVARLGNFELLASALQRRLARTPVYLLRQLGDSPQTIRRVAAEFVLDGERFALAARQDKLTKQPDIEASIREVYVKALYAEIQTETGGPEDISEADVKKYYAENKANFVQPTRLKLARIVVESRAEADKILQIIKTDEKCKGQLAQCWPKLVDDFSKDKTAALRAGDLGYVRPNGSTRNKDIKVNPVLYQAAAKVPDGQVVDTPILDGKNFVILYRIASQKPSERTFKMEAPRIRQRLAEKRFVDRWKQLLDQLRQQHEVQSVPKLVDLIDVNADTGAVHPARRPGSLPRRRRLATPASPHPHGRPGFLR